MFNRWDAGQQLACQIMLKLIDDIQQDQASSNVDPELIEAYRLIFEQPWQDLSYLSLLLILPSETYLSELMRVIDVDAIHLVRQLVKKEVASALQANFLENYHSHHLDQSGNFDATAIGRRKLKNTCLSYLAELETTEVSDLCERQFNNAKNSISRSRWIGDSSSTGRRADFSIAAVASYYPNNAILSFY